jgi:hypothetical protein
MFKKTFETLWLTWKCNKKWNQNEYHVLKWRRTCHRGCWDNLQSLVKTRTSLSLQNKSNHPIVLGFDHGFVWKQGTAFRP